MPCRDGDAYPLPPGALLLQVWLHRGDKRIWWMINTIIPCRDPFRRICGRMPRLADALGLAGLFQGRWVLTLSAGPVHCCVAAPTPAWRPGAALPVAPALSDRRPLRRCQDLAGSWLAWCQPQDYGATFGD